MLQIIHSVGSSLGYKEQPLGIFHAYYRNELFYQWMEIYYDPSEEIISAIDQFPYELFGYTVYYEFINDLLPQLISFYCLKNLDGTLNGTELTSMFNLWIQCNNCQSVSSNDYSQIIGNFFHFYNDN